MKKLFFNLLTLFCLFLFNPLQINAQIINEPIDKDPTNRFPLKQNGEILKVSQLTKIFANNPEANKQYTYAKGNRNLGTLIGITGGALIAVPMGQSIAEGEPNWILAGIGAGLLFISIPFINAYKKKTLRAVDIYNNGLLETTEQVKVSFYLENTSSGIGLVMKF